jgi:hypothetical protein
MVAATLVAAEWDLRVAATWVATSSSTEGGPPNDRSGRHPANRLAVSNRIIIHLIFETILYSP